MRWFPLPEGPGELQHAPGDENTAVRLQSIAASDPNGHSAARGRAGALGDDRLDRIFLCGLFAAALIANLVLATHNWHYGFLIGHEFRQAQTAIIAHYIDQQNNFSVHYETPLFGKPWEVPLEFPLYEWGVVLLSRITHWPHFESARTISLSSVYLSLPAIFLLLGQAGLSRYRRLLALALFLATPVYLFYGRTFLMDTTAMMFSAWFLAAFVQTMRTRKIGWLVLCSVAGAAGGLIKSLTFFVWLLPAMLYGTWCVWSDLRRKSGWAAIGRTIAWGFGAVLAPAAAVIWWVRFTDAIKEHHSSAYIFTSKGLTRGNFGMYDLSARLSKETWRALLECWSVAIAQPWLIGVVVLAGIAFLSGHRWRVLGAFSLFIAAQMMFPFAYAYQDYYFTACAVFGICALGFVLDGVFGSRLPRWCRWPLVLVPFAAFYTAYAGFYYHEQAIKSFGGTGLTIALRDFLPEKSVLIVSGSDWSAVIPYNSRHRALMIRNGMDYDEKYIERAMDELADEDVSALVLTHSQRGHKALLTRIATRFHLDREPTFSYLNADVYVSDLYRAQVFRHLQSPPLPEGITFNPARAAEPVDTETPRTIAASAAPALFPGINPAPWKFAFKFGYGRWNLEGSAVFDAHPDAAVWIKPPPAAREVFWEFGIKRDAYEGTNKTEGADFVIEAETERHELRTLYSRFLNPAHEPGDRGPQRETISIRTEPGESLVFRTRPHGGYAYDWCYWKSIDVH